MAQRMPWTPASRTRAKARLPVPTPALPKFPSSVLQPRSKAVRPSVVAGALLFAIFLVLAWGALSDGAHAEVAPVAKARPQGATVRASPAAADSPAAASRSAKRRPAKVKPQPSGSHSTAVTTPAATKPVAGMPQIKRGSLKSAPASTRAAVIKQASKQAVATATWRTGDPSSASRRAIPALDSAPVTAGAPPLKVVVLVGWAAKSGGSATSAIVAPPIVNQCNGTDNAGGQAVACTVSVTNFLDISSGQASSVVTVNECHGAANAPLTCVTSTTVSNQVVQSVTQCNGSGSGGGGTVTCSVEIVNNISGVATTSPATVNQCNGSGQGGGIQPTVSCTPLGATTNATVTQCNDSGNGGGAQIRVQCTVLPSTNTSALPVTVDQCNGSGNGGGARVTCTVSVSNNISLQPIVFPVSPPLPPTQPTPPGAAPPLSLSMASGRGTATAFFTPSGATGTGGTSASGATLAATGAATGSMAFVALLSILIGGLLVWISRRRSLLG